MKLFGYIKLDWSNVWLMLFGSTIGMYFILGVSLPMLYFIFGKFIVLILTGFLAIICLDIIMDFNCNLIEWTLGIFCLSVGGFFALLNFIGIVFSFFQYIKNKVKNMHK
jgi:hypothetical protein